MNLAGKRVLITRPRDHSQEMIAELERLGAQAIVFPTIEIAPVDDTTALDLALRALASYDWLVLTSASAVIAISSRLETLGIASLPPALRLAAIGPKTAARAQGFGWQVHFTPDEYLSDAIAAGLGDLEGSSLLLPTSDIAAEELPQALRSAGGRLDVVTAYHTCLPQLDLHGLVELAKGVDVLTFTSGSTVRNFIALVTGTGLDPFNLPGDPLVACIGPKTASVAAEVGLRAAAVSSNHTTDGLVAALKSFPEGRQHQ